MISLEDDTLQKLTMRLRPQMREGFLILFGHFAFVTLAVAMSLSTHILVWFVGQVCLALAMLQAFVIMHECGHGTFLPNVKLNRLVGWYAGWACMIPFPAWQMIHQQHHIWTGWQDIDPTTSQVVPRPLKPIERRVLNFCWRTGFPLFSILYRVNNYWNAPRLHSLFAGRKHWQAFVWGLAFMVTLYLGLMLLLGVGLALKLFAFANFLHLVLCDPILLSQHSHIPQHLSQGRKVSPFPVWEQGVFTRSLRFPSWFARWILLNFDAHEKHHAYPRVPGYYLHLVTMPVENEIHWLEWLRQAKSVPAETLLFKNRNQTQFRF